MTLAAGAAFGLYGVVGVALGSLFSRWGVAVPGAGLALAVVVHSTTAAIPAVFLRRPAGPTSQRLRRAIGWGVLGGNLVGAALGTGLLVAMGTLPARLDPLADNFLSWWVSDVMAALVLGLPLLLWLAPDRLLDPPALALYQRWRRDPRRLVACAALLVGSVVLVWGAAHSGWGFPEWASVMLVGPVAFAAFHGGLGAALWMNLPVSVAYFCLFALPALAASQTSPRAVLAPAYAVVGFFASFAIAGGYLAGANRLLLDRVRRQQQQLERDFHRTVASLSAAIEAKDPTTVGHVQRVANLAVEVGRVLGISGAALDHLRYGALLHDVGKIGVPEAVLNKPGPLDARETALMQQHVEIGLKILGNVEVLREVLPLVQFHQERWDGRREEVEYPGYFGLAGEQIPIGARILSVVDALDAMTNDRPYRGARPIEEALAELETEAGRQFDPRVVEVVVDLVRRCGLRHFDRASWDSAPQIAAAVVRQASRREPASVGAAS